MQQSHNFSLKEAAQRLGVSPHTLRTWAVYQHRVPYLRLGRRLLFKTSDLDEFERRHRVEGRAGAEGALERARTRNGGRAS